MKEIIETLEKRGFTVKTASGAAQAREMLLSATEGAASVGIGGSVTIQQLDVVGAMQDRGQAVHWHWLPGDKAGALRSAATADVYLASANALTRDGKLLFIDGTGNRTAAIISGPAKVILVIGKNKLVDNEEAGLARIRTVACPQNARRLNLQTPCALTGKCADCRSPQRMCNAFLKLEHRPGAHPVEIILVDEEMGY